MSTIISIQDIIDQKNKKWDIAIYKGTRSAFKFEIHITPPYKQPIYYFPINQNKIDWEYFKHNICLFPKEIREYADKLVERYKTFIAFY